MSRGYRLSGASVRYGSHLALSVDALDLSPGELTVIVGPNGAGKSTLVALLAGLRRYGGICELDGRPLRAWTRTELSRAAAFVPQSVDLQFPFTAYEVALMGRAPHADRLFESPADHAHVEQSMRETGTFELRDRDFRTLSGGEKQRVVLAAALAQSAPVLLLDEPAAHLDPKYQLAVYSLLAARAKSGALVAAVTHDLRLSRRFATRTIALRAGRIDAWDLDPSTFARVFDVDPEPWLGA